MSYWAAARARIDLRGRVAHGGTLSMEDLVRVLGDTGAGRTRKVLLSVRASDALPDLPEARRHVGDRGRPRRGAGRGRRTTPPRRRGAAHRLRRALHERIDEATASSSIVRYRENRGRLIALPKDDPVLKTSGHETIQALLGSGLITPEQSAEAHRVAEERGQSPAAGCC